MSKKTIPQNTANQIKQHIIFGVGYGQPPRHSQFKKGQSGNSKGRPPKTQTSPNPSSATEGSNAAIMSRVLNEEVAISRNGRRRKISKAEFVQCNTEKQAADGSILANRDLDRKLLMEDARRAREIAEDPAWWMDYLTRRETDIRETSAKGLPPTRFWIDPQDILFREGELVHIRGPLHQEEVRGFELIAQQLKIRMVEWLGRIISGSKHDDINDVDIAATLASIKWGLPRILRNACMTTWEELTDTSCLFGRRYEDLRLRIWAEAGQTPPRKFKTPIDLSPKVRKVAQDLKDRDVSPLHFHLQEIVDRDRAARRKGRGHIRRKSIPGPSGSLQPR